MEYERRLTVAQTPADLFAFLCDENRLTSWRDGLLEIRRLDDGAQQSERRYAETMQTPLGRQTVTVASRVDAVHHRIAIEVLDGAIRPHGSIALAAAGTGTELVYRITYETPLPIATPIDKLVFEALVGNVDRSLAKLARVLEAEPPLPT